MIHAPVAIRPAKRGDLPQILRLFARDELLHEGSEAGLAVTDARRAAFDAIDADPNNQVYVADLGGRVVGTFQLTLIRQLSYGGCLVAQLESVFVDPEQRSRGVGTAMMQFARAEAERRGALRLQLTSNLKRERAHRFYERLVHRFVRNDAHEKGGHRLRPVDLRRFRRPRPVRGAEIAQQLDGDGELGFRPTHKGMKLWLGAGRTEPRRP